jgi:hypothetical protein
MSKVILITGGTGFKIFSSVGTDTSKVAWFIVQTL